MKSHERIAPGVYRDDHNVVHFDIPELLEAAGWIDTPESRAAMEKIVAETVAEDLPSVPVSYTHTHGCPRCHKEWGHEGRREKCIKPNYAICAVCKN